MALAVDAGRPEAQNEQEMLTIRPAAFLLSATLLLTSAAVAQQANAGSKTRSTDPTRADVHELGIKPNSVLKVRKAKGVIAKVDLVKRSVTITLSKGKDPMELTFSQPSGREQIKTSKKMAKALGKKVLRLDEVPIGAKVQLAYYPLLGQLMELTVDGTS